MKLIDTTQNWIGLSTDTKPIAPAPGSTFFEVNTGWRWVYNGYAWLPTDVMASGLNRSANYKQIDLNQAAAAYDVMTATTQNLFIDAAIIHVPDDLSAVATFTGISVQTNDGTPIVLLSSTNGAKAKLTGNFYAVYRGPSATVATKKIQLTIIGATAGAGKIADITVFWRTLVAGGYYLNA